MKNLLNETEIKVLESVIKVVLKESDGEFGYCDDVEVSGLTKNQIKGYLSQLVQKKLIVVIDDEFRQTFILEAAKNYANTEGIEFFKYGF